MDAAALERAINQLVARHAPLRTAFVAEDGIPRQVVIPEFKAQLSVLDYRSEPPEDRSPKAERAIRRMGTEPFDLDALPLFRFELYRLDEDEYVLAICLHHIISDNWSFGVLTREMEAFYREAVGLGAARSPRTRARPPRLRALAAPVARGRSR